MKRRHKTLLAALALGAAAAVAAGIARSTTADPIPDANGVIHACYKRPIGEVKIVYSAANCGPGQEPIQWSQSGPQGVKGDPGPQGPQGPQGPPGAAGGSLQTFVSDNVPNGSIELPFGVSTGIFVTLGEPGTYWVFAKGKLFAMTGSPNGDAFVHCDLQLDFVDVDNTGTELLESGHPGNEDPVTLAGVVEATQPGQRLKLLCFKEGGLLRIGLFRPRLYALKVS
jgi:hypothetical protein